MQAIYFITPLIEGCLEIDLPIQTRLEYFIAPFIEGCLEIWSGRESALPDQPHRWVLFGHEQEEFPCG